MNLNGIKGVLVALVAASLLVGAVDAGSAKPVVRPDAATLKYVDKAKLPIAREVIRTFRRTKPSQRSLMRHTGQILGMSYGNVTNISGKIPARLAFKPGKRGFYEFYADFRGSIKPKNLVSAAIGTYYGGKGSSRRDPYGFLMGRTKHDGPTNVGPMHWLVTAGYLRGSGQASYGFNSCAGRTASGYGGLASSKPVLSVPGLLAGIRQARRVLKQASKGKPILRQHDVFAGRIGPSFEKCKMQGWNPQG